MTRLPPILARDRRRNAALPILQSTGYFFALAAASLALIAAITFGVI
jgi:hypothetical protein